MSDPAPTLFVLDGSEGPLPQALAGERLVAAAGLAEVRAFSRSAVVVAPRAGSLRSLAGNALGPVPHLRSALLVLEPLHDDALARVMERMFSRVLSATSDLHLLPLAELVDALKAPNRSELFIAGLVDRGARELLLYRGDLELVVFPVDRLRVSPSGPLPDLERLAIADYGQTVVLGDYEAATDAILFDVDPEYRRAAKKRQLEQDGSLGASIRRLRLLRGLARTDIEGVSEKEIARIERGEVEKPHGSTLQAIATRLGVERDDLGTY